MTLEKDNREVALRAFVSTIAGKVLSVDVRTNRVQELIAGGKYCSGLTLQTYTVPTEYVNSTADRKQVRLYMTVGHQVDPMGDESTAQVLRVNVNAIERWLEGKSRVKIKDENKANIKEIKTPDALAKFSTEVMATDPHNALARLAYINGKIYYLTSKYRMSAVLASTDVTVAVDCQTAMPLVAPLFQTWKFDEAHEAMAQDATPDQPRTEHLHETSPLVAALPWEFKAYRKVMRFNTTMLIYKEMLCSRPKPPTTRPSSEACCVDKRIVESSQPEQIGTDVQTDCSMAQVMKQL